jgi:hypothetical protein
MTFLSKLLPWRHVAVLACALFAGHSGAATGVGRAQATVLPSILSASVALYVRTAPGPLCTGDCPAAPLMARMAGASQLSTRTAPVSMDPDGVAQFTMFGATASNYIVRLSDAASGAWQDRIGSPIILEPTLGQGGGLSIIIGLAPSGTVADAFQVVINYN